MADPFEVLGVPRDADPRTIKQAYARLIKLHRPDREPEAFARIHAAYQEALGGPTRAAVAVDRLAHFEELLAERRLDELVDELRAPALRADADEDTAVAIAALRAIGALAWRSPDAPALLAAWSTIPREHGLDRLIDRVEHELGLAARWRRALGAGSLHGGPLRPAHIEELPEELVALIAGATLASPRRRRELLAGVDRLLKDPRRLLATCDRIAQSDRVLAGLLIARFQAETPRGARPLDRLPGAIFTALGEGVVELERSLHAPVRPWMIAAGTVGGVAAALTAVVPILVGAGVALGSAIVGSLQLGEAHRRYLARARPGFALLLARLGIQADTLRAWLAYNKKLGGDLATFDIAVGSDRGLALFASLASLVRETERAAHPELTAGDDPAE